MNIFKNETTEIETAKLLLIDFIDTFERLPEDSKKYFVENVNKVYGYHLGTFTLSLVPYACLVAIQPLLLIY